MTADIAAGRLPPAELAANFCRCASAAVAARGAGRSEPLLLLLRRALHRGLPDRHRHPGLHPQDRAPATCKGAAVDDPRGRTSSAACCARVCPTEILCERACVRNGAEDKPVEIGALQRYATDWLIDARASQPFHARSRDGQARRRGRRRAGGPRLRASPGACSATTSTVFEARAKLGGLNEYGIAAYKVAGRFRAARGRFHPRDRRHRRASTGKALGRDFTLDGAAPRLSTRCSSAWASPASTRLALDGRGRWRASRMRSTIIARAAPGRRQGDAAGRPAGRGDRRRQHRDRHRGAGKRLGAEDVTIVYRRGPDADERHRPRAGLRADQRRADQALGARRCACSAEGGQVAGVEFEYTPARRPAGWPAPARRFTLAGRHGVQGRSARRFAAGSAACERRAGAGDRRRPDRGRCRAAHLAARRLGRRRLRRPGAT